MRSFVILEVKHGETTDELEAFASYVSDPMTEHGVKVVNWNVVVDLPPYVSSVNAPTLILRTS